MKTKDKMIGAGIGLAALAAAGTYFLYGKKGSASRETIEGWALQMKGEVLEAMEKVKDINQQAYNELVEENGEALRKDQGCRRRRAEARHPRSSRTPGRISASS